MTPIQQKVFERVLNMAQMHQIGVLHRGPSMLWTCRWHEAGRQSCIGYELQKVPQNQSLQIRLRYDVLPEKKNQKAVPLDYMVPIAVSRSYKAKTWYWFVCPLIINGKPCKRRVRNLYFLPGSDYFGCKHCRDLMIRSLPPGERLRFRQTDFSQDRPQERQGKAFMPDLKVGWRPSPAREICHRCGCLSEGSHCSNCGIEISESKQHDYFEILGVDPTASIQAVRVAFTTRLKEYHPDRVAHLGEKLRKVAEEEIKHINLAYETLKDPGRRDKYLRQIGKRS